MSTRTITAVYDSETDARFAREQLVNHGVDDNDVRIVSHNLSQTSASSDGSEDKGVWESIKDFFVGDEDRPVYSEGLRRGSYLLTARVDDTQTDDAISVLEQTNAVDLDRRTEEWRSEGWSAGDMSTSTMSSSSFSSDAVNTASSAGQYNTTGNTQGLGDEQSIPIVEERLRVGKREVDRGGVRVRSYVVEQPVHEQVNLREEHVQVERRPVSDTTARSATDLGFEERTIEVSERAEEAVVAKDAVVTEEVVVRKTSDERTESIDDTVRHTEVDIDDTTGRSSTSGSRSTTRNNTRKR